MPAACSCTCTDKPESVLTCPVHQHANHIDLRARQTLAPWRYYHPRTFEQMVEAVKKTIAESMRLLV